jgi:ParB family chromosome partitioning protein
MMELIKIPLSSIEDNPWNPNKMTGLKYDSLVQAISKDKRLRQPLLVRQIEKVPWPKYQIVDGEHRAKAARQAKLEEVDCVVIDLTEQEAKAATIAMNNIKGKFDDLPLAALLAELKSTLNTDELKELTAFNERELAYYLKLLETPRDYSEDIQISNEVLVTLNFLVTPDQQEIIENKLHEINPTDSTDALVKLCRETTAQST